MRMAGDHGVLQVHRGRCKAEARIDSTGQEERGKARVPCIEVEKLIGCHHQPNREERGKLQSGRQL